LSQTMESSENEDAEWKVCWCGAKLKPGNYPAHLARHDKWGELPIPLGSTLPARASWTQMKCLALRRDNYMCRIALLDSRIGHTELLTVHHIVPRALGGTDHLNNLVTLCSNCHKRTYRARARGGMPARMPGRQQQLPIPGVTRSKGGVKDGLYGKV